jgi:hypothetical protein
MKKLFMTLKGNFHFEQLEKENLEREGEYRERKNSKRGGT